MGEVEAGMRRLWWLVLLAVLGGCPSCEEEDTCADVPKGGACTRDGECVLGFCATACCGSTEPCGAPSAYLRSAIQGQECLYEQGDEPAGVCRRPVDCLCDTCEPPVLVARCVAGTCTAVVPDGGM